MPTRYSCHVNQARYSCYVTHGQAIIENLIKTCKSGFYHKKTY